MSGNPMTPQRFVAKWRGVQLSERASVQEHFLDLCALFGQPSPATADPTGTWFAFEKGVTKSGGGQGFADVWMRGHFAWEYKKKRRDLGEAFKQLLLYSIPLENPPLLVVCDIDRYEIHTNFTGTAETIYAFTNEQIAEPVTLRTLRALFDDPEALRPALTIQQVTEDAARRFATLADGLRTRGVEPERAAHFLTQLLFCLFAEDVGLLPADAFGDVVRFGVRRPETFLRNATALFTTMRDGGEANLRLHLVATLGELRDDRLPRRGQFELFHASGHQERYLTPAQFVRHCLCLSFVGCWLLMLNGGYSCEARKKNLQS